MMSLVGQAAYDFSQFYERREEDRWALADICALVEQLPALVDELSNNFGISVTLQTLRNYARVSKSFEEEHRHLQYKWSNFLAWSKWENPIKAMEQALDCGYSPRQMDNLRKHGNPNYKKPKPELCQVCGGELQHCEHFRWMSDLGLAELERHRVDDEGETRRVVQRDSQSQGATEDRCEAVSTAQAVRE